VEAGNGGNERTADSAVTVAESYRSRNTPSDDIDSLAVWHGSRGENWLLATAKATHRLLVFEATTGELITTVGGPGESLGSFLRPNGVAVVGDVLLVVERDNARVQVLKLPKFRPLGVIGEGELKRPYGLAAFETEKGYELYVTDNYDAPESLEERNTHIGSNLSKRVRRYRFTLNDNKEVLSESVRAFGDTRGEGVLWKVESISADPEYDRLLIADELENRIKIYSLEGRFTDEVMGEGNFYFEPEGIALLRFGKGGWWVGVDQEEGRSQFRLFDRTTLRYIGTFAGESTANTDGIAITQKTIPPFLCGALFAVHDDSAVSAFDLERLAQKMEFTIGCGDSSLDE
jgi:3-phytase